MSLEKTKIWIDIVTYASSVGTALGSLFEWLKDNSLLVGVIIAILSYLTQTAISVWYKRRKLRILERTGVDTDGDND